MLLGGSGSVAVFDESGGCAATEFRQPIGLEGACEIGDSVLMQPRVYTVPQARGLRCNTRLGEAGSMAD